MVMGEGGLTAHPGTSLMDWAVDVERSVRRETAVVVYFMVAGSWWTRRDKHRERESERLDWCWLGVSGKGRD